MKPGCKILWWWIQTVINLSKPIECTTPRMNTEVNYWLWVIMMYWYWVADYNKRTILLGDVDIGRGCVCVGRAGGMWEISVLFVQFLSEPNTSLKNKIICFKKGEKLSCIKLKWTFSIYSYLNTVILEIDSTI